MIISLSTTFDIDERYTVDPTVARINKCQLVKSITRHQVCQPIGSGFDIPSNRSISYPAIYHGFWIEFFKPIGFQTGLFIRDEAVNLVTYDSREETIHFYDNQDTSWTIAPVVLQVEKLSPNDTRYKT